MSETSLVTISLTLTEGDLNDLREILHEGRSCGVIEHILEQYEEVKFTNSLTNY